jgi:hypothetical protein
MKKRILIISVTFVLGYSRALWAQPVTADYVKFDSSKAAPAAQAGFGFVYSDGVLGLFHRKINGTDRLLKDTRIVTINGTQNEITVSNSAAPVEDLTVDRTWGLSLSSTIDLGGKTSFEIPNAAAPTTDAFGEIAGDNNAWTTNRGAVQFYDGTSNTYLVGTLASSVPTATQFPQFQSGGTTTWANPVNINVSQNWVGYFSTANTVIGNAFFWENTNKTIGIDISSGLSSTESIHASKATGDNLVVVDAHDNTGYPRFIGRRSNGSRSSQTAVTSGTVLTALEGQGYNGSAYSAQGRFSFGATETWGASAKGTAARFQLTSNGSPNIQEAYVLYPDRIEIEGATDNTNELTLSFTDPTADRTVVFGNVGGDVAIVLDRAATAVDITNTTSETALYSFTVPANVLGTTRNLHVKIIGDFKNNNGVSENVTIRIKYGGTTFYDDLVGINNSSLRRAFIIDINMANQGSASTQFMVGDIQIGTASAPTTGIGEISTAGGAAIMPVGTDGTKSVASSSDQTFQVTVQWATGDPDLSFRRQYALAEVE